MTSPDPYAPPRHASAPTEAAPTEDEDLARVNPRFPKVAAGFVLLAGACSILNGVQIVSLVHIRAAGWDLVPYVLMGLGAGLFAFARFLFVTRPWAALGAIVVGGVTALVSAAWFMFATGNGLLTLYGIWNPMGAVAATALAASALGACRRAQKARERLAAAGMRLGL